jgi:hypothetical protein
VTVAAASLDPETLVSAAYGLALRISGSEERAAESVETVSLRPSSSAAAFLADVRREARARRVDMLPDPATAPPPPALHGLPPDDWAVVERVALRGLSLTEAAAALGIERREALLRLNRGMVAARRRLLDEGQSRDDAQAVRLDVLGGDLPAGGLDDAARDRQAEPAAAG